MEASLRREVLRDVFNGCQDSRVASSRACLFEWMKTSLSCGSYVARCRLLILELVNLPNVDLARVVIILRELMNLLTSIYREVFEVRKFLVHKASRYIGLRLRPQSNTRSDLLALNAHLYC